MITKIFSNYNEYGFQQLAVFNYIIMLSFSYKVKLHLMEIFCLFVRDKVAFHRVGDFSFPTDC